MQQLPKTLADKLNTHHPEVIQALNALNQAAQHMDNPLDALCLDSTELYTLLHQFNVATNASRAWLTQLNRANEARNELNRLCQQLNTVITVENPDGEESSFQLKPEMVQSIKISVEPYSEYNDQGGYSTHYSRDSVEITLDMDVAMAMNPEFFSSEDNNDTESLKTFFEDLEINISDTLNTKLELDWRCYDGVEELTQTDLAMAHKASAIGDLPALYSN